MRVIPCGDARKRLVRGGLTVVLGALVIGCGESPGDAGEVPIVVAREEASLEALDEVRVIADAKWTSAGDAWILNAEPPYLLLQAVPSEVLTSFGQTGDGPDELGFPSAIVGGERGVVTVLDRDRRALRTFDDEGAETASVPVPELVTSIPRDLGESLYGDPFAASVKEGNLVTSNFPEARAPGTSHLWNREVVRIDLATGEMSVVFDFREDRDRYTSQLAGASVLMPTPLWAVCPDGSVARYMPFADSISWSERVRPSAGVAAVPRPVEPEEVRVTIRGGLELRMTAQGMGDADIDELLPMALEQLQDEISPSAPAYVNMLCGPGPLLWLQTFSVEDDWVGRGRIWDVLDVDGEVISRVELPTGFRPFGFRNEGLYGAQTDALGVERLVTVSWEELPGER